MYKYYNYENVAFCHFFSLFLLGEIHEGKKTDFIFSKACNACLHTLTYKRLTQFNNSTFQHFNISTIQQ